MTEFVPSSPFRRARPADARAIAELMDMAAEGIMTWIWTRDSADGVAPLDHGATLVAGDDGELSYSNVIVAENESGDLIGMIWAYVSEPNKGEPASGLMAEDVFQPLVALEATVPHTLYIDTLAIFCEFRRQGWGKKFLGLADEMARHEGLGEISLIVSSPNRAKSLYTRNGFVQVATRPFVPCDGFAHTSGEWQLMTRAVTGS